MAYDAWGSSARASRSPISKFGILWLPLRGHPIWRNPALVQVLRELASSDLLRRSFPIGQAPDDIRLTWKLPAQHMQVQLKMALNF